jgi:Nitrile hydratase, alpha chain
VIARTGGSSPLAGWGRRWLERSAPVWYKSAPYRSRAVVDPRGVLAEFGVTLADDIEVRVWDSTAEQW